MKTYEILKNGKIIILKKISFKKLTISLKNPWFLLKIFTDDKLDWVSPHYNEYMSIIRDEKINELFS